MVSTDKTRLVERLGTDVMRFQDASQRFDEAVGQLYQLNTAERHCLSFLWRGAQPAGAIAKEVRLTPAAVTALVDRLERRGYVRRENDPSDRRKVMVRLTAKSEDMSSAVYGPLGKAGAAMLAGYSMRELESFSRILAEAIRIQEEMTADLVARHRMADRG